MSTFVLCGSIIIVSARLSCFTPLIDYLGCCSATLVKSEADLGMSLWIRAWRAVFFSSPCTRWPLIGLNAQRDEPISATCVCLVPESHAPMGSVARLGHISRTICQHWLQTVLWNLAQSGNTAYGHQSGRADSFPGRPSLQSPPPTPDTQ